MRNAVLAADRLLRKGHIPYVPHLTHLWHMIVPHLYEDWLTLDKEWLKICDAVLRLPGESHGADDEVKTAECLGIPVYYSEVSIPPAR